MEEAASTLLGVASPVGGLPQFSDLEALKWKIVLLTMSDLGKPGEISSAAEASAGTGAPTYRGERSIGLTVLPSAKKQAGMKRSGSARWRAVALVLVNVLIGIHIWHWLVKGMTISPVEPSESMYTLEFGQVNAGFIFFIAALLSTLIFGRFFCGWACHVVSLQDLSSYLLGKVNIRPKPFRTRLLLWGPLLIALYMFVWPTFKREALFPALAAFKIKPPIWLGAPLKFPGFSNHLVTANFWETFPPWFIAIPFLFICGFVCVYFLGSKGFCTYGCPYGGFFAPLDKLSIGRIVVSDACEGCGHCTAVCTSNVRVHQEVRDFGQVVDPGCMKCMDCVSVCPNHALSFAFAMPTALKKPLPTANVNFAADRPKYDLNLGAEIVIFALAIAYFFAFRGMYDSVPLLLSGGLAALGAFGAAKVWQIATLPSVRGKIGQLKVKNKLTLSGMVTIACFVLYSTVAAWSATVNYNRWQGGLIDHKIITPFERVFSEGYSPAQADKQLATDALTMLEFAGHRSDSSEGRGIGWRHQPATLVRLSWLHAVGGNTAEAERYLKMAIDRGKPSADWVFGLARLYIMQGKPERGQPLYEEVIVKHPHLHDVRIALAIMYLQQHDGQKAIDQIQVMLADRTIPPQPFHLVRGTEILIDAGRTELALSVMRNAVAEQPQVAILHAGLFTAASYSGNDADALRAIERASELDPGNVTFLDRLVATLRSQSQPERADAAEARLRKLVEAKSPGR